MPQIPRARRGALPPTLLQDTLLELFPAPVLTHLAEESVFVKRHRKVDPVAFFWAVALEAGDYLQRSLDQLRHVYKQKAAKPLHSYSNFYDRLTPELVLELSRPKPTAEAMRHSGRSARSRIAMRSDDSPALREMRQSPRLRVVNRVTKRESGSSGKETDAVLQAFGGPTPYLRERNKVHP